MTYANLRHRNSEKARHLLRRTGYKAGGRVSDAPAPEIAAPVIARTPLKTGGAAVDGNRTEARPDRKARASGGRTKKKGTTVNVIIAGHGGGDQPPHPVPVPVPMPPPGGPPPGGPPMAPPPRPMPPMPPPGAAPPPGMPPRPMANTGGRIRLKNGGQAPGWAKENFQGTAWSDIKNAAGKGYDRLKDAIAKKPEPTPPAPASDPSPPASGGEGDKPDTDDSGQKRGGRQTRSHGGIARDDSGATAKGGSRAPMISDPGGRKGRAAGGRLDTASPLDYEGSNKNANSIRSSKKNNGSSNEQDDVGEKRGGRQGRAGGGRAMKMPTHASGGGLGRQEKQKIYAANRTNGPDR